MAEVWNALVGRAISRQISESSTLEEVAPSLVRDLMTWSLLAET
jgi:hypothetical protein